MVFSNYHSHSTFCDGRSSMEDFVHFAIAKGIRKYGFSSHAPLPFLTKWTMLEDDFDDYEGEFHRLKTKYADRIELFLGLEVDFIENTSSMKNTFFQDKKLDYVIGSIHYLDKMDDEHFWSIDGAFDEFDMGLKKLYDGDIRAASRRYFEVSQRMIEAGGIDIVGHMDKITMHGSKYPDFNPTDKWFVELAGTYLEKIKKLGLIVEINTKSLENLGLTFPHQSLYPLMRDLEIPVHVNSDCHYPTNVVTGFEATYRTLKNAGFRSMQQLINGSWQAVEFDEKGLKF